MRDSGVELEAAVRADLAAGDLGRRWLLADGEMLENCYSAQLYLTYRVADQSDIPMSQEVPATGTAVVPSVSVEDRGDAYYATVTITLQTGASRTLALLEELADIGADQGLTLRTQRQEIAALAAG